MASKAVKRLEVLQRETRGPKLPSRPQRYLLALSRGPSSTALLHILNENLRRQRERNQRVKFELVVVFVEVDIDVDGDGDQTRTGPGVNSPAIVSDAVSSASMNGNTAPSLDKDPSPLPPTDPFTTHFPDLPIHKVSLSDTLSSPAIDWSSLPAPGPEEDKSLPAPRRLASFFAGLPSASARADTARLLTRHALFAAAAAHACGVVLLGYNTTALAELTLCEAAKGRGFGISWLVNDGAFPLPSPRSVIDPAEPASAETDSASPSIQIYSPLREIFRKEILTYLSVAHSSAGRPLSDLFFPSSSGGEGRRESKSTLAAVVSHRDLSLDEVVSRFFADVEASYPSVVANVVRTTGKLNRAAAAGAGAGDAEEEEEETRPPSCGLCAVRLDPLGDDRWKGEIGEVGFRDGRKRGGGALCYGCERSVRG